jgi:hypothetical protein
MKIGSSKLRHGKPRLRMMVQRLPVRCFRTANFGKLLRYRAKRNPERRTIVRIWWILEKGRAIGAVCEAVMQLR